MTSIIPVILCGGSGKRLWPLSTEACPKQLLPLLDEQSLLQKTVLRVAGIKDISGPLLICNQQHCSLITEQLQKVNIQPSVVISEPIGRNTAPAITIAALQAISNGQDPLLLILPSDHIVTNLSVFHDAVEKAKTVANDGKLVTFGIVPKCPETGYGYIKAGSSLTHDGAIYNIDEFVEKPNLERAQTYLKAGNYYWNSGMFMFRASCLLKEMERHALDILQVCRNAFSKRTLKHDVIYLDKEIFSECTADSIDYAIMEKTSQGVVMPIEPGWSDIGSWQSLWEHSQKDVNDNVVIGNIAMKDVRNSYLRSSKRKIVAIGMENCVIVETDDAVLVIDKNRCQNIKEFI